MRKAGEGMGKSGSFFFQSHDDEFLIKTMTESDYAAFKKLFRAYFEHIKKNQKSMLARIYGVYSVEMGDALPVFLIMLGNCKKCENDYVKRVFDLKGSEVKRREPGEINSFKNTATLKDMNFEDMKKLESVMMFNKEDYNDLINQMRKDAELL